MRRLDTAFRRDEGWDQFHRATSILGASAAWAPNNDAQRRQQTPCDTCCRPTARPPARRPPHTGSAAFTSNGPSR